MTCRFGFTIGCLFWEIGMISENRFWSIQTSRRINGLRNILMNWKNKFFRQGNSTNYKSLGNTI